MALSLKDVLRVRRQTEGHFVQTVKIEIHYLLVPGSAGILACSLSIIRCLTRRQRRLRYKITFDSLPHQALPETRRRPCSVCAPEAPAPAGRPPTPPRERPARSSAAGKEHRLSVCTLCARCRRNHRASDQSASHTTVLRANTDRCAARPRVRQQARDSRIAPYSSLSDVPFPAQLRSR